jgi:hypothetical protein
MGRPLTPVLLAATAIAATGWVARGSALPPPDVGEVVARIGDRLAAYYERAQRIVCLERSTVTPIDKSWSQQGLARTVESELRLEMDGGAATARVTREIRRINGREPRDRDKKDRSGCTDPTPLSPEMLTFLLPGERDGYRFTAVREGREADRAALIVDFASVRRDGRPELIEDEGGHDDCFDWKGPVAVSGRLWVDAATHDVLRLDRHISGPTDVRVPFPLQRKYRFDTYVTIDRDDVSMRYKEVAFSDPHETMLLPESIQAVTVMRNALQSTRRTQVFSNYRRFLTGSRIKGIVR